MPVNIDSMEFIKKCNAGWQTQKLAQYFACSERTIRNYKSRFRSQGLIADREQLNKIVLKREKDKEKKERIRQEQEKLKLFTSVEDMISKDDLMRLLVIHKTRDEVAKQLHVTKQKINNLCKKFNIMDKSEQSEKFIHQLNVSLNTIAAYKTMPRPKDIAPEHFVTHFTDWHAGKKVIRENDKITFDTGIFHERVHRMLERPLYLLDHHVKFGANIGMVDILNTGDLTNGENIYPGQEFQQEASPPDQVMLVVEAQIKFIKALLAEGYPVRCHCVRGNHGRTSKDGDPSSNWDVMIYKILDFWQKINKVDNCEIIYTESEYLNTDINGWKYHLRHIAFEQGDTSAGRSKFHGWGAMHDCDALVYGHWHHWGALPVDHLRVLGEDL